VIDGASIMELQALEQFVLYTGVRPTPDQVARAEAYASA
jgi:shikimate dehydrogenase